MCLFLFRWFPENNWGVRLLNAYAAYGILLAAEPLLLCTWGYTPGKWIFGLAVRNRDGGKLTWGRALSRTWGVFARGEGYGIPIYVLWRNYKCWRRCRDGEPEDWEEDTSYTMKDESGLRIGGFAAAPGRPVWPEPAPGTSGDPDAPPPGASHSGGIRRQRQRLVPEAGCVLRRADERGG